MQQSRRFLHLAIPVLALALAPSTTAQELPPGYVRDVVVDGLANPVGLTFDAGGRLYVWERAGYVYIVEDGVKLPGTLLDLHREVGAWADFGMLGFALDPDFLNNGYVYAYYVVDRHHLLYHRTGNYDPAANEYYDATIGRITRYTADPATGFTTVIPESRLVLLGDTIDSGVPITHVSHGTGALVFGEDGTLLASAGDGASFTSVDTGSHPETYWEQALADGIIRPAENVGAFRAQMIGSLSGKILRIDPATGDGVSSNPFFDPAQPRSPRSRVYAVGLRNPFRIAVRPGTGDPDPNAGNPGALYVGDVGWAVREDLHVATEPGVNFGWPLYEGLTPQNGYAGQITANQDAPNPLYGQAGCNQPYFMFQELLAQEQADHSPSFPNPCDPGQQISPTTPTFMHHRPELDYRHGQTLEVRIPIFDGNEAAIAYVGDPGSPVAGEPFTGNCAVAGVWHSGLGLDDVFRGLYFHLDYGSDWLRAFRFDEDDEPLEVLYFGRFDGCVAIAEDPMDGSLVYVSVVTDDLRRVRYTKGSNVAPTPVIEADTVFGAGPLTVRFDATSSIDLEDARLTYDWDFGDGAVSTLPSPIHTFAPAGSPTRRTVTLTVTDDLDASAVGTYDVFLENTPPQVEITSFANGAQYSTASTTILPLEAMVKDREHGPAELSYAWEVSLHHNNHSHPEPIDTNPVTTATIFPTPCSGEFYAYRVVLTVTDAEGLATTVESWLLPDCDAQVAVSLAPFATGDAALPHETVYLEASTVGAVDRVDFYVDGQRLGQDFIAPYTWEWTAGEPGAYVLSAHAVAMDGSSAQSLGRAITVLEPQVVTCDIQASADDAEERSEAVYLDDPPLDLADVGPRPQLVGLRFGLDVPHAATITRAYVQFTALGETGGPMDLAVRAEAADDAAPITSDPLGLTSRTPTQAAVPWTTAAWRYDRAIGALQRTPDLRDVVQEVVDRPGWAAGNALLVLIDGSGQRTASAFDGPFEPPRLVVEFGLKPKPARLETPIASSSDDAQEDVASGTVDTTGTDLSVQAAGSSQVVGLRFQVDVPVGATILGAHLQLASNTTSTSFAGVTLRAEATGDASPIVSAVHDLSARATTAASVDWLVRPWETGAAASNQRSPDMRAIVQEIVDRPDWSPGQSLLILATGVGDRTAASYDADALVAPVLTVVYE